jgi:alginate O-acetyltransferase complex protein AlgI
MVFSSTAFLFLFLPAVLLLYYLPPAKLRNPVLIVASLFFYAHGEQVYVLLMVFSILCNYAFGLAVSRAGSRRWTRRWLALAVAVNLGMLGAFKYANFLADNLDKLLGLLGLPLIQLPPVHLPIGISFFTFQAMSYVIDVYRRDAKVQTNPLNVGLYVSLFPQLIAGPIVRYHDISEQLTQRSTSREMFASGVRRFAVGLAKKVIVADTVAIAADGAFGAPIEHLTFGLAWLGVLSYTVQIYFDFSGYSDMAIGLGRMLGFQFKENFNYPYISASITEFWRRWHISLSTWYRDYLYIPLGGNRISPRRTYANLVVVFFLCGLWHGASWTFVVWGLYHGFFLVLERLGLGRALGRLWRPLRHLYVLLVVVAGWVFFRAETFPQAMAFFRSMVGLAPGDGIVCPLALYVDPEVLAGLVIGTVASIPILPKLTGWWRGVGGRLEPTPGRTMGSHLAECAFVMVLLIAATVRVFSGTYSPFIYFRF